jgi:hypothetical protein
LFIKGTQKEFKLMSDDLTREIKVNGDKYERIDVASIHLLYQRKEKNILETIEAGLKQAEENSDKKRCIAAFLFDEEINDTDGK